MQILIVDDNKTNLVLLSALSKSVSGNTAVTFDHPQLALDWCELNTPDLVLVDYVMPLISGHEFIQRFRALPDRDDVPIIMITSESQREVRQTALALGATEFLTKPVDSIEFKIRVRNLLALRAAQNKLKNRNQWLAEEVQRTTCEILDRERELVLRLARAAECRDPETGSHIARMASYAVVIAEQLGCDAAFVDLLAQAAPMHDIGKLGIPDYILLKPGRLDADELVIMRRHAEIGSRILADSLSPLIRLAANIAHYHHEQFNGEGYPAGLKGLEIPLECRIVAVADVFDALTSSRPYKRPWGTAKARQFIIDGRGQHFCPECCDAFLQAWERVLEVRRRFPDEDGNFDLDEQL
jgi:response regulator RpfG family c-di-GMP phosphodiesterase